MRCGLTFVSAVLRAVGQSTQHHRFRFASVVALVSASQVCCDALAVALALQRVSGTLK